MGPIPLDPKVRYLAKVDQKGPDECWPWMAARFDKGYGAFRIGDRQTKAHRFAYELHIGPIPDGLYVCHTCDNPPCQNPAHFFLGTHGDNARDRERKGRSGVRTGSFKRGHPGSVGATNGRAKLTEGQVRKIRALAARGFTQQTIGDWFGLSQTGVGLIVRRVNWKHVE